MNPSTSCAVWLGAWLAVSPAGAKVLFEGDSAYNHVVVQEQGGQRCMSFGQRKGHRQTCVDLQNRDRHVFEYTPMMLVGFAFRPDSKRVGLVGLGGGALVRTVVEHLPGVRVDVAELDPLVVRLAKTHFGFRESKRVRLVVRDGRQFLRRRPGQFDQVLIDAFGQEYVPPHMTTREFFQQALRALTDGGLLVMNTHHSHRLFEAQLRTMREVFPAVAVFQGDHSGNSILVGARALPVKDRAALLARVRARGLRIPGVDLVAEAGKWTDDVEVGDAPLLTDDHAPANLLLFR